MKPIARKRRINKTDGHGKKGQHQQRPGHPPARLNRLRGQGRAGSPLWNRIKADVTGLAVIVPEITETTALGAAFLALVGIGAYTSLTEVSEHIVKIHEIIEPDPTIMSVYADAYEQYRETYFAMLPVFEKMATNID